jgi:hypothetical protein
MLKLPPCHKYERIFVVGGLRWRQNVGWHQFGAARLRGETVTEHDRLAGMIWLRTGIDDRGFLL